MAVVESVTARLVPFPVQKQRRTLEPDGILYGSRATAGDGSGGNIQHRYDAPTSHLYVLRSIHLEHAGTTNPGSVAVTGFSEWLFDASSFVANFAVILRMSQAQFSASVWFNNGGDVVGLLEVFRNLILGTISPPLGANDITVVDFDNVNAQTSTSRLMWHAYRKEAFTVPGILDRLRSGLVR